MCSTNVLGSLFIDLPLATGLGRRPPGRTCGAALTSPSSPHPREAERNVERCLHALDERGETGLQAELDRIFPTTVFKRVPLANLGSGSYALLVPGAAVEGTESKALQADKVAFLSQTWIAPWGS